MNSEIRTGVHLGTDIASKLKSAIRDCSEAIRILDSTRRSEEAGRLHALCVELRELAAETETGPAAGSGTSHLN